MINKDELRSKLEAQGIEYSIKNFNKACRAASMEEAIELLSPKKKWVDPDMVDWQEYGYCIAQAEHWANLSGQVGDTLSPEDLITYEQARAEKAEYDRLVNEWLDKAETHFRGACRWANRRCSGSRIISGGSNEMTRQYILTEREIRAVRDKLNELRQVALLSRDCRDRESNREFYLRAKGFEDALRMLGIIE